MEEIGLLANPISGDGSALIRAEELKEALFQAGFRVSLKVSSPNYPPAELHRFLEPLQALVVLGGDGTIMSILDALADTQVPLFAWPAGNESLFSREFGMQASVEAVLNAIRTKNMREVRFGLCFGRPFFHMVSIGFDSMVVNVIAKCRRGPIGNRGYVPPILKTIFRYQAPTFSLRVDDAEELQNVTGYLVIANSKQYAGGLMPVPEADSGSSLLHARFYPYRTIKPHLTWIVNFIRRSPVNTSQSTAFSGKKLEVILADQTYPVQGDGDLFGWGSFTAEVSPATVRVLLPA